MTWLADTALWAAIALTGLASGMLVAWRRGPRPTLLEGFLLAAAAAAVAGWCARAGQVLGGPLSHPWLAAWLPIDGGPLTRLAVLWATLPGASLTAATILLVWLAMSPHTRSGATGARHSLSMALCSLFLLGGAAWFTPGPGLADAIPPFAQDPYAAIAPLFAVVSLAVLGWAVSVASRTGARTESYVAWLFATGALACEQVARSELGIGPRDAVLLGSASSGLVLWLLTGALLHSGVRRRLFGDRSFEGSRPANIVAHAGAACVVASFALHAIAVRRDVVLPPGQPVEVTDVFRKPWRLVNQGVSRFDEDGVEVTSLAVEVHHPGAATTLLTPERRDYHGLDGQHLANGIVRRRSTRGPLQAMRILFTGADSIDVASVRVTFLPAPMLWPAGVVMLLLAGLIGLAARESSNAKATIS
jgi:hypothetical protein